MIRWIAGIGVLLNRTFIQLRYQLTIMLTALLRLTLLLIPLSLTSILAFAHEVPDVVRVKVGKTTTFAVVDRSGCKADVWIDEIEYPELVTFTPMQSFGDVVEFTVSAGTVPVIMTVVIQWVGEHVGKDEGHCREDTRDFGGFRMKLRITPDFVNSVKDTGDLEPGEDNCDTDGSVVRGDREEPECTLRAAIEENNAGPGGQRVTFDIPETGPYQLQPTSPYPAFEKPIFIAGSSAGGAGKAASAPPVVILDGSLAGAGVSGLTVATGGIGSEIEGLIIISFGSHGVLIQTDDVVVHHCYIGTDQTGADRGNSGSGVYVDGRIANTIGSETSDRRNVISGNQQYGVELAEATNNRVIGNWIGISHDGGKPVPNRLGGVYVRGGGTNAVGGPANVTGEAPGNVISGNGEGTSNVGILIVGDEHFVRGNLIGTDHTGKIAEAGEASFGNLGPGVRIEGTGNVIGGDDPRERNVISNNSRHGIFIESGDSEDNRILGNYIGTDIGGTEELSNRKGGILILESPRNVIGGDDAGARNVISSFKGPGIEINGRGARENTVFANHIGTNADGVGRLAENGEDLMDAVLIEEAPANEIGGTTDGRRNVIAGSRYGIHIRGAGADSNRVQGNLIGIGTGGESIGNVHGVLITSGRLNEVGGSTAGARNVISASDSSGVKITGEARGTRVRGNYVGTDRDGAAARGNLYAGIHIDAKASIRIGGTQPGERNVISGNKTGILIRGAGADSNRVEGNYVGIGASGNALGNSQGIVISEGRFNVIGGSDPGARNVISGNDSAGVKITLEGMHNEVRGNYIGTNPGGTERRGNGEAGVIIEDANENVIGGSDGRNVISGNRHGIEIRKVSGTAEHNDVKGNYIGIDVNGDVLGNEIGVLVRNAEFTLIGGTNDSDRNFVSGNTEAGIKLAEETKDTHVFRNYIGTGTADTPDENRPTGNRIGILIEDSRENRIGESDGSGRNVIAGNQEAGIQIVGDQSVANRIRRNRIFANATIGIDLAADGATRNDSLDVDAGPNDLLNFPVIDSVRTGSPNQQTITVYGRLDSRRGRSYQLELFVNDECHDQGYGEGKDWISTQTVQPGATFVVTFTSTAQRPFEPGDGLAFTATDPDGNTSEFSRCWEFRAFRIVDHFRQPIRKKRFGFSRVRDNRPTFTETFLDSLTTDNNGYVFLDDLEIEHGDSMKVAKRLESIRHKVRTVPVRNAYNIYLDNGKFRAADHTLYYDEVDTTKNPQNIILDHTTVAYNLVVSVEWDATPAYVTALEESFRRFANYMYDVGDGQIRLDTVLIYKNKANWGVTDMEVFANNLQWPMAHVDGVQLPPAWARISMPRFFFGTKDDARRQSVGPGNAQLLEPLHYRTIGHEFGHFGLGLWDEYLRTRDTTDGSWDFVNDAALRCGPVRNYGFMQSQYPSSLGSDWDTPSSEMSWRKQYEGAGCRNTKQFLQNGRRSSWDHFRSKMETFRAGIWAPILRPDDRDPVPASYFLGPNDGLVSQNLDYDVGKLVKFPIPHGATTRISRVAGVLNSARQPLVNAQVTQRISSGSISIVQGNTSDEGRIRILGYDPSDVLEAQAAAAPAGGKRGAPEREWFSGTASDGEPDIIVRKVAGTFPLIAQIQPSSGGFTYRLESSRAFSQLPELLLADDDQSMVIPFSQTGDDYIAVVSSDPRRALLTTYALDDSSRTFFFTNLLQSHSLHGAPYPAELFGYDGNVVYTIDSTRTPLERAMLVSSPYPPLRNGLVDDEVQAGEVHTIALHPEPENEPEGGILIRYEDALLDADESTLRIFRWGDEGWELVGGWVDTEEDFVSAAISGPGVYGAFTTTRVTSIDEAGALPQGFALHPAYPNPFNARAVIRYEVAQPAHVHLAVYDVLGRRVAVLVDEQRPAGRHQAAFDGARLSSGIYFYRIQMGNFHDVKTMVLVK